MRPYPMATGMILMAMLATATLGRPAHADAGADELLAQARPAAIEQVLASSRSEDPFLRANALEASQALPERALPLVQLGLEDEHPAVRFAALVTIGRLQPEGVGQTVREMMTEDESASVRAAARFAAHAAGDDEVDLAPLSTLLASPDPGVRSNVAMLLAEMGDPSAVPMLAELARLPMHRVDEVRQALTRVQVAEAMATLGDEPSMDALRAGAYSTQNEVRVISVQALGKLGDRQMAGALRHMLFQEGDRRPPIEIRIAAAEALARMGDTQTGLATLLEGAGMYTEPDRARAVLIRAQAAMALAHQPQPEAVQRLTELLEDEHEQVRLAAAAAVLRSGHAGGAAARRP